MPPDTNSAQIERAESIHGDAVGDRRDTSLTDHFDKFECRQHGLGARSVTELKGKLVARIKACRARPVRRRDVRPRAFVDRVMANSCSATARRFHRQSTAHVQSSIS